MSKFIKIKRKVELAGAMQKHVLSTESSEVRHDYMQGLVFLAVADESFHEMEKLYILELAKSIGLNEEEIDNLETFANNPDEDELLALIERLKDFEEETKISFLLDVALIAFKDGQFDESEMELFNEYVEILSLEMHSQNILILAEILHTENIDNAISFYGAQKTFYEKFSYMFELLMLDVKKEIEEIFSYEWVRWDGAYGGVVNDNRVALAPVSVRQFCIFLNSVLMERRMVQMGDTGLFELDGITLLENFDDVDRNVEYTDHIFTYQESNAEDPIVGFDEVGAKAYVEWLNNLYAAEKVEILTCVTSSFAGFGFKTKCLGKPEELEEIFACEDGFRVYDNDAFEDGRERSLYNFFTSKNVDKSQLTFRLMQIDGSES